MIKDLTVGKPTKVLFFFTLPMLLGNIFQQLYNVVDSIVVGRFVGADALAAVGSCFSCDIFGFGNYHGYFHGLFCGDKPIFWLAPVQENEKCHYYHAYSRCGGRYYSYYYRAFGI